MRERAVQGMNKNIFCSLTGASRIAGAPKRNPKAVRVQFIPQSSCAVDLRAACGLAVADCRSRP